MRISRSLLALFVITVSILLLTAGCEESTQTKPLTDKVFLSVDFQPNQVLKYQFTAKRDILVDWKPGDADPQSKKKSAESLNMVIVYKPVEVDPYGLTTIEATFESVKASKTGQRNRDAANSLEGKTFTFQISPNGKIKDLTEFRELLVATSKNAMVRGKKIKAPDMLDDVISCQWHLWESAAKIENPAKGIAVGDTWTNQMLIPTTMVIRKARNVTYELTDVNQTDAGNIAVISSTYQPSEETPDIPLPYEGAFKLQGTFGFFRAAFGGYNLLNLEGSGTELYNVDAGRIESSTQNYKTTLKPKKMPLPGAEPIINISQKIEIKLIQ